MGIFANKIADLLISFTSSLHLFLPAFFLVVGFVWLVKPSAMTDNAILLILMGIAVITVSHLLYVFNTAIISIFKGNIMPDSAPAKALRAYQLQKFYRHHHRIYEYQQRINRIKELENTWQLRRELSPERERQLEKWQRGWLDRIWHEKERLEERYPPTPDRVLATGFGNTIAAFELYPACRYRIDIAHLWPLFVSTLHQKKYNAFIESEKAILDFCVNLLLVISLIWVVDVIVFACTGRPDAGLSFVLLPILACVLYRGSCVAAANWGATVKAAFDLYRFELKKVLNLQLPDGAALREERAMWQGISEFLAYGRLENFGGFDYTSAYVKMEKASQKEEK